MKNRPILHTILVGLGLLALTALLVIACTVVGADAWVDYNKASIGARLAAVFGVVFALVSGSVTCGVFCSRLPKLLKVRAKAARDALAQERLRFRRVWTEPEGDAVAVYAHGGDIGRRCIGRFTGEQREEMQDAIAEQMRLSAEHRARVEEAEALSAALNRSLA